jgi:hypothetical protein
MHNFVIVMWQHLIIPTLRFTGILQWNKSLVTFQNLKLSVLIHSHSRHSLKSNLVCIDVSTSAYMFLSDEGNFLGWIGFAKLCYSEVWVDENLEFHWPFNMKVCFHYNFLQQYCISFMIRCVLIKKARKL